MKDIKVYCIGRHNWDVCKRMDEKYNNNEIDFDDYGVLCPFHSEKCCKAVEINVRNEKIEKD